MNKETLSLKYHQMIDRIDPLTLLTTGFKIIIILLGALALWFITKKILNSIQTVLTRKGTLEGEPPSESAKRIQTLMRILNYIALLVIFGVTLLLILREMGIQIGPILASVGIVGLAVGFGAQNLVKDVISGFFLILENQVRVSDVAVINGTGGLVETINLRTIVLRDLGGVVHIFPHGSITTLSNLTNEWSAYVFDIGIAYKEDTDKVIAIMRDVGAELLMDPKVGKHMLEEPEIFGVDKFADSAVIIKGRIRTKPIRQWDVGREYLRRIKKAFDAQGVEIPFPHRSIYFGEGAKPMPFETKDFSKI